MRKLVGLTCVVTLYLVGIGGAIYWGLETRKKAQERLAAPDNRITYTLQDQEGRVLRTCDGDPEEIWVCLESVHGSDQAAKRR